MEQHLSFVPIILSFLLFLLITLKILAKERFNSTPKLPPGPWRLPVLGNLHNLIGSLPHHKLRDLANKYGPLMHLKLGEFSHIVVSSPEIAQEMLKTHDVNFSQRPFFLAATICESTNIVCAPYGDYWKRVRKICTEELLSPSRVKSFRSIREEEVSNLIKYLYLNQGLPINLSEQIFSMTYGITAKTAFGNILCQEQKAFISSANESIETNGGFSVCELFPSQTWLQRVTGMRRKLEKIVQTTHRILGKIIKECEAEMAVMNDEKKPNSLLAVLLSIQDHGDQALALKTKNIMDIIVDIFIGGGETSSTTLEWAMLELLKNPRVMKKAQAEVRQVFGSKGQVDETGLHELEYLKLIIRETLRLHPPAPLLLPRESKENCVLNGYDIPAKTKVLVNAWAIGRDPRYWTEAEKFDPERFIDSAVDFKGANFELIPFGAGRRICPGISFAVAIIELTLAQLLYNFDWKLPHGIDHESLDMNERFGITVRRKEELYLIPVPCGSARTLL